MSSPGWYKDPAAGPAPGPSWRWWDGERWTAAAAAGDTPPVAPPASPGGAAPAPPRTIRPTAPWLIVVVALVAAGAAASQANWATPRTSYLPPPGPGAAVSAPAEPARPASRCPVAVAAYRNPHPDDANTRGGRLVAAKSAIPYDQGPTGGTPVLGSLEDTRTWFLTWQPGNRRQSGITLGELRRTGHYTDPQAAARAAAACMAADPVRKADVTAVSTVSDAAVTVDGRPGWQVVVDVTLNPAKQLGVTGERLSVVVVDDGRSDWLSALAATVRLDHPDLVAAVALVPGQLRVE